MVCVGKNCSRALGICYAYCVWPSGFALGTYSQHRSPSREITSSNLDQTVLDTSCVIYLVLIRTTCQNRSDNDCLDVQSHRRVVFIVRASYWAVDLAIPISSNYTKKVVVRCSVTWVIAVKDRCRCFTCLLVLLNFNLKGIHLL